MAEFEHIDLLKDFSINPFDAIGKEWMLITAAKQDGTPNTMTAAWGGLGWLWERPVAFIFVRQTRYTKEFIDDSNRVSLTFFGKETEMRKKLTYLGRTSGRDEDKIAASGLTLAQYDGVPYFKEARLALFGHCISSQLVTEDTFMDTSISSQHYPDHNLHTLYVVEIDDILKKI